MVQSIHETLLGLHSDFRTWRAVAKELGAYSGAYWSSVASGKINPTVTAIDVVRSYQGLPSLKTPRRISSMKTRVLAKMIRDRVEICLTSR